MQTVLGHTSGPIPHNERRRRSAGFNQCGNVASAGLLLKTK